MAVPPFNDTFPRIYMAARLVRKLGTLKLRELANLSSSGYFKAMKVGKNKHWSSGWRRGSPPGLRLPAFRHSEGAETSQQMNKALLGHFFPLK